MSAQRVSLLLIVIAVALGVASCQTESKPNSPTGALPPAANRDKPDEPPPAAREFRAAWVATVGNIDWPSRSGLSTEEQQREILQILDRAQEIKLNAIVLQVRTTADALYDSKLEPWSAFLTGKQGKAPDPYYDPLKFWIDQCHARGIELHAWFNPYRTNYGGSKVDAAPTHISQTHPEIVKNYGKMGWMDPGEPAAQQHSLAVFMDVVDRYDVDGIHIDDYFYPYPEPVNPDDKKDKREIPFPDDISYGRYVASGGKLKRDDWRRQNINTLIEKIHDGIKQRKKQVQFGISPFGIPRPGLPGIEYVKGFDQYNTLYADSALWLHNGWCDYIVPQLYWKIGAPAQPYLGLLQWWTKNNPKGRHVYGGLFTSRIDSGETTWYPDEILGQIELTRLTPGAGGNVHFSMIALDQNRRKIGDLLRDGLYSEPALVPQSPWLASGSPAVPREVMVDRVPGDTTKPVKAQTTGESATSRPHRHATTAPFLPLTTQPAVDKKLGAVRVTWSASSDRPVWLWTVYYKQGPSWKIKVVPGSQNEVLIRDAEGKDGATTRIAVSSVDRAGTESARVKATVSAAAK